ncbi:MAG: D-cysteine desulfhydrase family protein [Pseudomonadota bacterium]
MKEQNPNNVDDILNTFERVPFLTWETPLERLPRLSETLGIELSVKRDDLTGLAFGGNKVRSLEYYFGKAKAADADTVLITGAIQSNYVRVVAACAARLGMECHIQLEDRVPNVDTIYRKSGNVLLNELLGATLYFAPTGIDEEGADLQLAEIATKLTARGRRPFIIPLGPNHLPYGSLGYIRCSGELLRQTDTFDHLVLGSGSGQTHAGMLFGLRARGWNGKVIGICVRRAAAAQRSRISGHCEKIAAMLGIPNPVNDSDIELHDDVLHPGYGVINSFVANAIKDCARLEGLFIDPVYTGRVMAGLRACTEKGLIPIFANTIFLHTGGLPAIFGYETALRNNGL